MKRARAFETPLAKTSQLNHLRSLRIAPRQAEFDILPKSVRFNFYLMKHGSRDAFQIDGMFASYLKEVFAVRNESLFHFFSKYIAIGDLVDYPYGILFTSESAVRRVLKVDMSNIRADDILQHAGKLLDIPCSIVRSHTDWMDFPHQIGIVVDGEDVKQFMCTSDEFDTVMANAFKDFQMFRTMADAFNREFVNDPIARVELKFRAKTAIGKEWMQDMIRSHEQTYDAPRTNDVRLYTSSASGATVSRRLR